MRFTNKKSTRAQARLAAGVLLMAGAAAFGQQQVNLTAAPSSSALPDGSTVPMWGYTCGAAVGGSSATCARLSPAASGWSPVIITVPTGETLQINLTNNLSFATSADNSTAPNNIPTSLVIVGQLGGGLGSSATYTASPDHTNAQTVTWPIANNTPTGTPPPQGPRVQSFASEVPAVPGSSGTQSPMSLTWAALKPGTYLIESGTHPSIQGPMGLYGIVVVTAAPTSTGPGTAYPGVTYSGEIPLLMSEIDPVQNATVQAAVSKNGFSETTVWSGQPNGCGNPASTTYNTCYPPAVNYSPLYYLFNGVAFDKTNAAASNFPVSFGGVTPAPATGNLLVRFVNAGLRMHVPSIVNPSNGNPAVPGMALIAEDGNPLPGKARVQNEVFLAAGKTYDVMVNLPASGAALPVFDRQLSLSANSIARDAGMLAYISTTGGATGLPASGSLGAAVANPDTYNSVVPGHSVVVSDPSKGVIANDVNVSGVAVFTPPAGGTLALSSNGTFTYTPNSGTASDTFTYCANGTVTGGVCSSGITALVTLGAASIETASGITLKDDSYAATNAAHIAVAPPGVLTNDSDAAGYPLSVDTATIAASGGLAVTAAADGSFNATAPAAGTYTFTYKAKNSQGTESAGSATVTVVFPQGSGLAVRVLDGHDKVTRITDFRWIIEEDRTFYVDPNCTTNPPAAGCPTAGGIVPTFGTNFHTSHMPVVAAGCTGPLSCESGQTLLGAPAVCDIGNGTCRTTDVQQAAVDPSQVPLDPTKRYYISVLPGDAANPFQNGYLQAPVCASDTSNNSVPNGTCGHGMGGAPVAGAQLTAPAANPVTVLTQPAPYQPAKLSVFVFEDDFPLNGEPDAGGGVDVLAVNEPGLGSFNITLFDDAGGTGDATGQMTYDMFNQPLTNSLAGTKDPLTGLDACPISAYARSGAADPTQTGITGTIVTCPRFESDGKTLSPFAGQAVIANMMPGRYGVVATPGADRIARGEEWLQTNTLDGQKAHDSFLRIGEPSYFQEFGPAGYHVSIGFANPKIINGRLPGVCKGTDVNITGTNCNNTLTGRVTTERMSRTPDERLYSSGSNDSFAFTQCYVSFGDPDGEDFAFTKCDDKGNFTISGLPDGSWRITVFDQWNDMLVDGLSTPVLLSKGAGAGAVTNIGDIAMNQWQANIYTSTFFDTNGDGVRQGGEPGLTLVPTNIRFRDGSFSNFNNTDLSGNAGFNEVFPLFSWYVIETDSTRYKNTGTHVVYDAGGPADGACQPPATAPCETNSNIANNMANTIEQISVPAALRVPGAVYCDNADCVGFSIAGGPGSSAAPTSGTAYLSTGRIDPPWVTSEGWQGFSGQNSFIEFGKKPFAPGENGGIRGHVVYASTRPFDDPQLLLQTSWEPLVPNVAINLYQEGTAPDGSKSLTLVDTTTTSSFDDWAQGFRADGMPNMNCPGQGRDSGTDADLFFFTLFNQPMWLNFYNSQHGGPVPTALPANAQFKCYDGMHNWNQVQPAPYDGMYQFPSIAGRDSATGAATGGTGSVTGTNCKICVANPTDGTPMLPNGKYVVEVVVPPGFELVKEEDKNILIGDNYIAPATVEFPGLGGSIYILPDQAEIAAAYNANNPQNPTVALGRIADLPSHEGDTGSVESFWPCVGAARVVPDYISLFPNSAEVAPFAGATRNLCDRKEVSLDDQTSVLAKFYVFTSTHIAAHFTGVITDDFTSEFDPFAPTFGEKFSPPNMPVSFKDWTGTEISRVYADQWGTYNGLTYSTWEVNPPNPTGYAPTMMVTCMNDPGTAATPDPLYNPAYSQFCYEIPFMPGQTQYMDTPVVPTSAFAGAGYNLPDCSYSDATPAIKEVDGDGVGPWVAAANSNAAHHTLTITALGDQTVYNNGYSGPAASTAPFNQKSVTHHYGFGTTKGTVSIGGASVTAANITTWNDSQIIVNVPNNVPTCTLQQQAQYGAPSTPARCGELSITTASGKQSIDTVTVTVGGKPPTHVGAGTANPTIQGAIDAAAPGDLIMVNPGVYNELVLMWKPVRLQGAGAAATVINANTQPAGKLDPWRAHVNCLFGLSLNGQPLNSTGAPIPATGPYSGIYAVQPNPYDSTGAQSCPAAGWAYFYGGSDKPQIDRIPLEGIVGWDVTLNGNLAELLQEPTLMGAYEGAGITVLGKGVRYPANTNVFGTGPDTAAGSNIAHEGQMPLGTTLLGSSNADCTTQTRHNGTYSHVGNETGYSSNFQCNPSRIDGLSITNSSQGGGGVYVHGWAHNLEIANNRVYNNTGTLTGGITVGQGESPDALLVGNNGDPIGLDQTPWTCLSQHDQNNLPDNAQLPYCYNTYVAVHNNYVTRNSSIGDELFSSTPAGAGGATFCTGSDYYKFNSNWICGNLSTGDGGGMAHLGYSWNGDVEHNAILFNQSTNPTVPTNGGGLIVMGAAPDGSPAGGAPGTECGSTTDVDCAPGLSDGTGPNLVINANLIMGNAADSGSGGGLRLQDVNGTEVAFFPRNGSSRWNSVTVTNNIIANNVAGWDGGGVSMQDALNVDVVNNTIISNDSTASSGVLFNTIGAPLASAPGATNQMISLTSSAPQPAGLSSMRNTTLLSSSLPGSLQCPAGHGTTSSQCRNFSVPRLYNNVIWENRSFFIGVGSLGAGSLNQQNVVALYNSFNGTRAQSEPSADATSANGRGVIITGGTGACVPGVSYWDLGVRGDRGPADHTSGLALAPAYSILTDASDYPNNNNLGANPSVVSQYCNGSRTPPEFMSMGYQVPPGISDATVPNPIFNLTPAATVDEGNNWINMSWGPLSLTNTTTKGADGNYGGGAVLGEYDLADGSPGINYIPRQSAGGNLAPNTDFYGNARPSGTAFDVGAVEFQGASTPLPTVAPETLNFGNVRAGTASSAMSLTLSNPAGAAPLTGIAVTFPTGGGAFTRSGGTCTASLNPNATCTINVVFNAPAATSPTVSIGSLAIAASAAVIGSPVALSGTAVPPPTLAAPVVTPASGSRGTSVSVTINGTNFTPTGTTLTVSGNGVTVSGATVQGPSTITATFTISTNATLTARNVTVTTAGGSATANGAFTVTVPPPPTLTSISPTSHTRGGQSFPVTLIGSNFTSSGTSITVSGNGITQSGLTVQDANTIAVNFRISGAATRGARTVRVTTPGGTSGTVTFTVQ